MTPADELRLLSGDHVRVLQFGPARFVVRPLTLRRLPAFAEAVAPLIGTAAFVAQQLEANRAEIPWASICAQFGADLAPALALACDDADPAAILDLDLVSVAELARAVVEVNAECFGPRLLAEAQAWKPLLPRLLGGLASCSDSSRPATGETTSSATASPSAPPTSTPSSATSASDSPISTTR